MGKDLFYTLMRLASRILVNSHLRVSVWKMALRVRPLIPREFMITRGNTAVAVGIPYFRTIKRFSQAVGPNGRVIVIEADEGNRVRLESSIQSEDLKNITIIGKAAWSQPGTCRFLLAKRDEDHRIENTNIVIDNDLREEQESGSYRDYITVETSTIDLMMEKAGVDHIDYIEITVNGAEFEVIKGMSAILPRTSIIFAKGHVREQATGKPINVRITEYLATQGFDTTVTRPSKSVVKEWGMRDGDVYAWKASL